MKAVLKFNLSDPDESKAHLRCVKSTDMAIFLFDLLCNLKEQLSEHEGVDAKTLDTVFDEIYKLANENGIIINELID